MLFFMEANQKDVFHNLFSSNINFKPKYCFRVLSGKNANIPRPPLIVDFFTESHKYEFLSRCRGLIKEFKDTGESMMIACKKG